MGAIVALIGFNLAQASWSNVVNAAGSPDGPDLDSVFLAFGTVLAVVVVAGLSRGMIGRVAILVGFLVGYPVALGKDMVDLAEVDNAAWVGPPARPTPSIEWTGRLTFVPAVF